MTRTHVSEGELVELGRQALAVFRRLYELAERLEMGLPRSAAPEAVEDLAELAREVSDQVDALCEYIRHSRMLD